jgi:hypothetical protein
MSAVIVKIRTTAYFQFPRCYICIGLAKQLEATSMICCQYKHHLRGKNPVHVLVPIHCEVVMFRPITELHRRREVLAYCRRVESVYVKGSLPKESKRLKGRCPCIFVCLPQAENQTNTNTRTPLEVSNQVCNL